MGKKSRRSVLRAVHREESREEGRMEYIIPEAARAKLQQAFLQRQNIETQFNGMIQLVLDAMGVTGQVEKFDVEKGVVTVADAPLPTEELAEAPVAT